MTATQTVTAKAKAVAAKATVAPVNLKAANKAKQEAARKARDAEGSPNAIRARSLVAAYTEGAKLIGEAKKALEDAKGGQLTRLAKAAEGMPANISPEVLDSDYMPHIKAALLASGTMDAKSVPMTASRIKTALLGLLHGVKPLAADTSIKAYSDRARPALVKKGVIEDRSAGDGDKRKQKASSEKTLKAAAYLVAGKNEARAQRLLLLMSPEHVKAFDEWSHGYIVAKSDNAKPKAKRPAK